MRKTRNPDEAPKGKAWAVVHMSHVAGGPKAPRVILKRPSYALKSDALRVAGHVDKRLQPDVLLIDLVSEDK